MATTTLQSKIGLNSTQTRSARKYLDLTARIGYAARAAVYALMGVFATMVAMGYGGGLTDAQGSLRKLLGQPFGATLLTIMAVGLFAYAIWRAFQAAFDLEDRGSDAKGI